MRVLIVEDDFISRKVLLRLFNKYADCDIAQNGREALEKYSRAFADRSPYDVILMDIMMPEMNGHEALEKIRALEQKNKVPPGREVKVIMVTALDDTKNVCKAFFQGGCTAYVTKPIDVGKIREELEKFGCELKAGE